MANKEKSQRMRTRLSVYVYLLYNDLGESIRKVNKRYPHYSRNTIWRHAIKDSNEAEKNEKLVNHMAHQKTGTKKKIMRAVKLVGKRDGRNFTSKEIQYFSGINKVTNRTVRNVLNKNGYAFTPTCRKILFGNGPPQAFTLSKKKF